MLGERNTDFSLEMLLLSIGAVLGTLPVALSTMLTYFGGEVASYNLVDFIHVVVFWVALFSALGMWVVRSRRSSRQGGLIEEIRARNVRIAD